jgi:uncharacterized pyridoxamine 5'-phosphate oxidase family protein
MDDSYAAAGDHLRRIFTEERRIPAADLPELLTGVQVLALATVTAAGEPRVAPVDGHFYKGRFWFGSAPDSFRFRHIRERPQVSAAVTHGEELAVIVHGTAVEVNAAATENRGFREYVVEVYGGGWNPFSGGAQYARIEPSKMFTYRPG